MSGHKLIPAKQIPKDVPYLDSNKKYQSIDETAKKLNKSNSLIQLMVRAGEIKFKKLGGLTFIPSDQFK